MGFIIECTICNFLEIVCCIWIKAINLYIAFVIKFVIVCKMPSIPSFPCLCLAFQSQPALVDPSATVHPRHTSFLMQSHVWLVYNSDFIAGKPFMVWGFWQCVCGGGGAGSFLIMARVECFHTGDTIGIPHEFPEFGKWTAIPLTESVLL